MATDVKWLSRKTSKETEIEKLKSKFHVNKSDFGEKEMKTL